LPDVNDFNTTIIEEFRANGGKLGGPFEGATMLLLHHKGAKSGKERVNPLAYRRVGDSLAVFASKGGAPTNPDWYYNLRAHPETEVEVGTETIPVVARVADDAEREPIWEAQKRDNPGFADYEKQSPRQIPVVILEPVA
jgi:deazaflavin-dependent oxidoreductase (nitroreductase family)